MTIDTLSTLDVKSIWDKVLDKEKILEFTIAGIAKARVLFIDRTSKVPDIIFMQIKDWVELSGSKEFLNYLDPTAEYEILKTGNIGCLLGTTVWTDAYIPGGEHFLSSSWVAVSNSNDSVSKTS